VNIPFLTLPRYAEQVIEIETEGAASEGTAQGSRWLELETVPAWISGAVSAIFAARDDALAGVYELDYRDINGLGNHIYRLDGAANRFCLKVLGKEAGNGRETLVWEILGYGENGAKGFRPIRGLPPKNRTFVDANLRTVMTPYYEGVLEPISGGAYELPLVLAAVLTLEETLTRLHERGMVYMDLCPSNILFKETPEGTLLFFLADMGGVKPLASAVEDDDQLARLRDAVIERRWTRRESLPPAEMFPTDEADPRRELRAAYDHHTLARSALVMAGLGVEPTVDPATTAAYPETLSLEDLSRPTAAEIARFVALLEPWLKASPLDEGAREAQLDGLRDLFRDYFLSRACFVGQIPAGSRIGAAHRARLPARMLRYKMALGPEGHSELVRACEDALQAEDGEGLARELARLEQLPVLLRAGDRETVLALLRELAGSRLLTVCATANYAWYHHRKLARCLWGAKGSIGDEIEAPEPARPFEDEPEQATAKAVRRGGAITDLGLLTRAL